MALAVFSRRLAFRSRALLIPPGAPWMSPASRIGSKGEPLSSKPSTLICWNPGVICPSIRLFRVHRERPRHSRLLRERHGGPLAIRTTRFPSCRESRVRAPL